MTSLGKTEATDSEADPEEKVPGALHQEVSNDHAAVKPVGELRKLHRGRKLATERRQKSKEQTRGNCGSRNKLAATGMLMISRTGVTRRKGHGLQRRW
jgi:hypothetical protein